MILVATCSEYPHPTPNLEALLAALRSAGAQAAYRPWKTTTLEVTPTPTPHKGEGKEAWFRARDSLPLRCAPAGNDTEVSAGCYPRRAKRGKGIVFRMWRSEETDDSV